MDKKRENFLCYAITDEYIHQKLFNSFPKRLSSVIHCLGTDFTLVYCVLIFIIKRFCFEAFGVVAEQFVLQL